jgi:hypothetical protein
MIDEGAGDGDALLFAAREFSGEVVEAVAETDFSEQAGGGFAGLAAADHGGQADIFEGGEFREEEIILEDVASVPVPESGEVGVGSVVE